MQSPPQKHHYIPQFYSKLWADGEGKLIRFDRPHSEVIDRHVFPVQIGFQKNLYTIPGVAPDQAQSIELSFFKKVDDAAARALETLLAARSSKLGVEVRINWSRFILSLMHRTPKAFEAFKEGLKILISKPNADSQAHYDSIKNDGDPATLEEFLQIRDPNAVERAAYSVIPGLMDHRRLGTHIVNMKWSVLDLSSSKYPLLLSDSPLITSSGIGNPDGHILLPLGPRKLFFAAINDSVKNQMQTLSNNEISRKVNKLIVGRAQHFVAATDLRQKSFILKNFGCDPVSTLPEMLHNHYLT